MPAARENALPEDFDDFVVECDEHLAAARTTLLDLESARNLTSVGREKLDALFRAFHTIKGLSGMVGVRPAEETAHILESYLVAVRKGDVPFTESGVDALLEGVDIIENAVDAFRRGNLMPDASALRIRVASLVPLTLNSDGSADDSSTPVEEGAADSASGDLPPEKKSRLEAAMVRGERAYSIVFSPRAELAARGVNVGAVRNRLQAMGEIVHAEPVSVPGGVQFRFIVVAPAGADLQGLTGDGVVIELYAISPTEPHWQPSPRASSTGTANLVRVDLRRLDDVMRTVGELVLSRARLERGLTRVARSLPLGERRELEETAQTIDRQLRDLREEVMRVRMVPVRDLFARMRLVVRDLTRENGKQVEFAVEGEETEIDKFVVERMGDPLLHLVRNAVDHGLELVAERTAAGKSPKGRLTLRAAAAGGMIVLSVEDDGRGIRAEDVFGRARTVGLVPTDAKADPSAVLDLLCTPGFSTRETADRGSGRGVGMDVVRVAIEALGGTLSLDTQQGVGTRFTARLPLTLAIADVLTVAVGDRIYAVPQTAVREVVPIEPGSTTVLENNELIRYRGGAIPLLRLSVAFGHPQSSSSSVALVTGEGSATVALVADQAIGLREVVVRSLADPLVQTPGFSGATELGDGRPILILDPSALARLARRRGGLSSARLGG